MGSSLLSKLGATCKAAIHDFSLVWRESACRPGQVTLWCCRMDPDLIGLVREVPESHEEGGGGRSMHWWSAFLTPWKT